jgi:ABC-2 type transport system permease protein
MPSQASAIVWAQWRSLRNHLPRANVAGLIFTAVLTALWYGAFAYVAVLIGFLLSRPREIGTFHRVLPAALLVSFLYWQVIPVLLTSMGASLDLRKLQVYPIPNRTLFTVEVLLRVTTGLEMLLLFAGAAIGLLFNHAVPFWAPFTLAVYVLFNLFCATGVRDLLVRLLARKRIREIMVFLFVIAAALPQLMLVRGSQSKVRQFFGSEPSAFLPWTAAARLVLGDFTWLSLGVLLAWTLAAYVFGRSQFERGLRFDAAAAASRTLSSTRRVSRLEWWYQLPNAVLPDPLGALIEKELRFLDSG